MSAQPEPLLTAADVAAWLNVSIDDVYRRGASGALPSLMIGRSRRFRRADVEAFLDASTQPAPTPIRGGSS